MDDEWARENLEVIRTLMERAAVYRHALAPVTLALGCLGMVGWGGTLLFSVVGGIAFLLYWGVLGVIALSVAFLIVRFQALRDSEPFWSMPTRRVALALAPACGAGIGWSLVLFLVPSGSGFVLFLAPPLWMVLYGCGMHAAGFFMKRGIKLFGVFFILAGLLAGFGLMTTAAQGKAITSDQLHGLMGVTFGGFHLAYGIYLYFTEKRKEFA